MKTIGIIGAGNIGKIVAAHLLKNNIPVSGVFSGGAFGKSF